MIRDNIFWKFITPKQKKKKTRIIKWYLYKIVSIDLLRYLSLLNYKVEIMKTIFNLKGGKGQSANKPNNAGWPLGNPGKPSGGGRGNNNPRGK